MVYNCAFVSMFFEGTMFLTHTKTHKSVCVQRTILCMCVCVQTNKQTPSTPNDIIIAAKIPCTMPRGSPGLISAFAPNPGSLCHDMLALFMERSVKFFFSFIFSCGNAIEDPYRDGTVLCIGAVSAHNQYFLFSDIRCGNFCEPAWVDVFSSPRLQRRRIM